MKKVSRLLKFIATGAFGFLLSACYGMPAPMYGVPMLLEGVRVRAKDSLGAAIPAIKVSFVAIDGASTELGLTDNEGGLTFDCDLTMGDSLRLEDVDGSANGVFSERIAEIPASGGEFDVVLEQPAP